jgi:hypothetical protein
MKVSFLKEGAFDAQGIITVPTTKLLRRLGSLPQEQLGKVELAMATWPRGSACVKRCPTPRSTRRGPLRGPALMRLWFLKTHGVTRDRART